MKLLTDRIPGRRNPYLHSFYQLFYAPIKEGPSLKHSQRGRRVC